MRRMVSGGTMLSLQKTVHIRSQSSHCSNRYSDPSLSPLLATGTERAKSFWHMGASSALQSPEQANQSSHPPLTVADFVERSYIPDFVAIKRPAGRAHFQAILKHILPPERVAEAFAATGEQARNTLP